MNRRSWLYAVTGLITTPLLSGHAAGAKRHHDADHSVAHGALHAHA